MKKIKIAIGDAELEYGSRLAQFLLEHEQEKCEVCVYTKGEILLSDLELDMPDVVLCTYPFYSTVLADQFSEQDRTSPIIILLNDGEIEDVGGNCRIIDKYQSAEEIVRRIYRFLSEGRDMTSRGYSVNRQILGVFAPWQQEISTLFALTLAQVLAKKQRVLYISLQECSGFERLLEEEYEYDLADVIAMIREKCDGAYTGIRSTLHRIGEADYIPPVSNPSNAVEINGEDICQLLKLLREQSDYEVVILETGGLSEGVYEALSECDSIYSPYHESRMQQCRRGQLEDRLEAGGHQRLTERMQYLKVPRINTQNLGQENLGSQLLWSELGNYIREYVTGEQAYGQGR